MSSNNNVRRAPPPLPPMQGPGRTECDTTNIRLREKTQSQRIYCCSCANYFETTNIVDLIAHFKNNEHQKRQHSSCLYCNGSVHMLKSADGTVDYYHDCYRSRNNLDC